MSGRLVIGCMTGTSIDGLDAALVRVEGSGLGMRAAFVRGLSREFLPELGGVLRELAEQRPATAEVVARANQALTLLHVEVVSELMGGAGGAVVLVCAHGQTVFHQPPVSWQMFNPGLLAQRVGVPVVCDLRQGDLAAGGQGAPITPLADWVLFRSATERRGVVNLGGFCNATVLGPGADAVPGSISGGDICVCNNLLDAVARRVMGVRFDQDGASAAGAEPDADATDDLLGILTAQRAKAGRRSLGTGDEVASWIGRHWRGGAGLSGATLAASACEGIGQTIAEATRGVDRVLLAGGGVRNRALVRAIASCASAAVETTGSVGVPVEFREAVCFAVLGALCADGVPITLPGATGVGVAPIAGVWAGVKAGVKVT